MVPPLLFPSLHFFRHATKVRGLEAYGIDPAVFGRQVQKRFACSTAAQPAPVRGSAPRPAIFVADWKPRVFVFGSPSLGDGCPHGGVFHVRRCGGSGGGGDGVCESAFSLPYAQLLPLGLVY